MDGRGDHRPAPALTRRTTLLGVAGLALAGCASEQGHSATSRSTPTPSDPSPSSLTPSRNLTSSPTGTPVPTGDRISLPTLMREVFDGGPVTRSAEQPVDAPYRRFEVTYPAGGTTVSGILLRPDGPGPFPGLVLNHGYIDPAVYVTGQGLVREQDRLAREGFCVLHTDYRGHAASDPVTGPDGDLERESRLGYTRDTLHAVASLKRLPAVDPERVGMLGRSMGGGVTLNAIVAQPEAVRAAVVHASVSSSFVDNLRQFTEPGRPGAVQALYDRFGRPRESPASYEGLSSRTFLDRVEAPLLALHGTRDDTCPPAWAQETQRLARDAGVDATLETYDDGHAFGPAWEASMRRTIGFLRRRMDL